MIVIVMVVAFLAAAGLALDGSRKLGGLANARELASNSARACAQGTEGTHNATGQLNVGDASQRAHTYLAAHGVSGTVDVAGRECTVTVSLSIATVFLPGPWQVSAASTSRNLAGITEGT